MRDMRQILAKAARPVEPPAYQLTAAEIDSLMLEANDINGRFNALGTAFDYGFILGQRCERAEQKKKRSA